MKLYSTKNHNLSVDLETAVFNSLPADKGLYMPTVLPQIEKDLMANWDKKTLTEVAFDMAYALLKDDISAEDLIEFACKENIEDSGRKVSKKIVRSFMIARD